MKTLGEQLLEQVEGQNKQNLTWKSRMLAAGIYFSVESGEYSDYSVWGFFKVLKDFSPAEQRAVWMAKNKPEGFDSISRSCIISDWLRQGFIEELDYATLHFEGDKIDLRD